VSGNINPAPPSVTVDCSGLRGRSPILPQSPHKMPASCRHGAKWVLHFWKVGELPSFILALALLLHIVAGTAWDSHPSQRVQILCSTSRKGSTFVSAGLFPFCLLANQIDWIHIDEKDKSCEETETEYSCNRNTRSEM